MLLLNASLRSARGAVRGLSPAATAAAARALSATAGAQAAVGFIGLGNMGSHMCANLLKEGKETVVFDLDAARVAELEGKGATSAATVGELAKQTSTIITMLPASQHVKGVLTGDDGVLANAQQGSLIIDSSTIDPNVSRELHQAATDAGCDMVDAPVSGGVTGAEAGTLTFMCGGEDAAIERARELLMIMGGNIIQCGPAGAGEITKLCNNLALAIQMIGTSEALGLGKKLGMDPSVLAGVMNTSTARCWSSDTYNPCPGVMEGVPSSRGYTGGFAVALMEKDLGLALDAAKPVVANLPLGAHAHQLYQLMKTRGEGHKDFSSVFEFLGNVDQES